MSEPPQEFLTHCTSIPDYFSLSLSEADTRAYLVDPVLRILGYSGVNDLRREVPVPATKEFLDYELFANGKAQAIVEAKALRHSVTDQAAAQCVQYAAVLGDQWCIITNGVTWAIYNAHARGPLAEKRVAVVKLDGSSADTSRAWSVLALFERKALAQAAPLTSLLADCVVEDELAKADSPAIAALRKAINDRFGERVTTATVLESIRRWRHFESAVETTVPSERVAAVSNPVAKVPRARASGGIQLRDLVAAGMVPTNATLTANTKRGSFEAVITSGGLEFQGKVFPTLSAAAGAATGGSVNGWEFWYFGSDRLSDLRAALAANS